MRSTRLERILAVLRLLGDPVLAYAAPDDRLCVCRRCGADAVALLDWTEADGRRWRLQLRCGQCGSVREVLAEDEQVSELAADLERHAVAIESALVEFERRCMRDELATLRQALDRDLIDASDFAR